MSDPLQQRPSTPRPPIERIQEGGDVPNDHPTAYMMYSNGGILLAALAALFFCLKEMGGLFVLSIVLILLLALFNLWTLLQWRRKWPSVPSVRTDVGPRTGAG